MKDIILKIVLLSAIALSMLWANDYNNKLQQKKNDAYLSCIISQKMDNVRCALWAEFHPGEIK